LLSVKNKAREILVSIISRAFLFSPKLRFGDMKRSGGMKRMVEAIIEAMVFMAVMCLCVIMRLIGVKREEMFK
jgi:hypothetical protein